MATWQARFQWTDDKLINFIKPLQKFREIQKLWPQIVKVKFYESVKKSLNRYI